MARTKRHKREERRRVSKGTNAGSNGGKRLEKKAPLSKKLRQGTRAEGVATAKKKRNTKPGTKRVRMIRSEQKSDIPAVRCGRTTRIMRAILEENNMKMGDSDTVWLGEDAIPIINDFVEHRCVEDIRKAHQIATSQRSSSLTLQSLQMVHDQGGFRIACLPRNKK
jgi:hypothetical protein